MNKIKTLALSVIVACGAAWMPGASMAEEERLTNEAVIELHNFGFGEETIVNKIKGSKTSFDTSLPALRKLKAANLPDGVIAAMIEAVSSGNNVAVDYDPNDPMSKQPAGIYIMQNGKLTKLLPSTYNQTKTKGFLKQAFTFGVGKVKSKAIINGRTANLVIRESRPEFYFYFEKTDTGLSDQNDSFTNPGEFVLAEFDVKRNKDYRELVVSQMNITGAQSGAIDSERFSFEELKPGIYKVTPDKPLKTGEYCFYYGGSTPMQAYGFGYVAVGAGGSSAGKVSDFSIQ